MTEEKKKPEENPPHISRREFALGSMAMLSGYAMAGGCAVTPNTSIMPDKKLEISPTIQSYMEVRHILEEDVRKVIDHAERTGKKLYRPDAEVFLSKLRVKDVYFYAEYTPTPTGYRLLNTYSHRFFLEEDAP